MNTPSSPVQSFFDFVAHAPTAFHAVEEACTRLQAAGFTRLDEHAPWRIAPGSRCYVTRNRSAVVAFCVPE